MTPEEFLNLIHGPDALIYFQVGGKTWKNKPQTFRQAENKLAWRNAEGDDICFIVNAGGTTVSQISRINAVFIDWDVGRDGQGRYYPEGVVRPRKAQFLRRLRLFPIKPSIIVETRNGFHAYWLLNASVTQEEFRICQKALAACFGSDPKVCNPNRAMRLPGYKWVKRSSGCDPFLVQVILGSDKRHRISSILSSLPVSEQEEAKDQPFKAVQGKDGRICAHDQCNSVLNTIALIVGAKPQVASVSFPTLEAAMDHLKRQDLAQYLHLPPLAADNDGQAVICPFHSDSTPSASIARLATTGHWVFKCHSARCGVQGTIIDLAQKLIPPHDFTAAIHHLFEHYGISVKTPWREQQLILLEKNTQVILDDVVLREKYPSLWRLIGRIAGDLLSKLRVAQRSILSDRNQHEGRAVFCASLREFHRIATGREEHPKYSNRQNEKVDRYCVLGLMNKLADDQMPPELLASANELRGDQRQRYRIQCYSFPAFSDDVLRVADDRACRLIEVGASVRGISFELITDLFGLDLAENVYPQRREKKDGGAGVAFRSAVEEVIRHDIARRGYSTVGDIHNAIQGLHQWASVTERRIAKCLPGVLMRNRWTKTTCDKAMKDNLGVVAAGYPQVIVPVAQG